MCFTIYIILNNSSTYFENTQMIEKAMELL